MKVSIIGSAGRNGLINNMKKSLYRNMIDTAYHYLCNIASSNNININDLIICSGGAALSDHVAITLYLENKISNLELHLPCHFDTHSLRFVSKDNTANSANKYHSNFFDRLGINSMMEISASIHKGAKIFIYDGFFRRNNKVAKSEYLIAFTFDDSPKI